MRKLDTSFEILLLNDASPDQVTWPAIRRIAAAAAEVRGIDLLFNTGQFRTIICGLEQARGRYVIMLDDDFQNPPEEIPKLVAAMQASPELDCIMGEYQEKHHGMVRNFGSYLYRQLLARLYGMPSSIKLTSFVIMKRELARAMCLHRTVSPVIGQLIYRTTSRVANTPVEHSDRIAGESGYSFTQLVRILFDNLFSASVLPLRLVSYLGLTAAFAAFFLAVYYLVKYYVGGIGAPGFMTLVILIIFFGGMTLLSIGLIGEYLIRIIAEVRRPPRFVIREQTPAPADLPAAGGQVAPEAPITVAEQART
jgi:dolichol-phosphate mannosyltransferase/undecaprenyl-phosphate 4-deoxy-4-formamido-L-arabinose transferase